MVLTKGRRRVRGQQKRLDKIKPSQQRSLQLQSVMRQSMLRKVLHPILPNRQKRPQPRLLIILLVPPNRRMKQRMRPLIRQPMTQRKSHQMLPSRQKKLPLRPLRGPLMLLILKLLTIQLMPQRKMP